jgi:sterol desaturase/sphingolipid hydroxylase (fatty acid hydroxylase superfamily)
MTATRIATAIGRFGERAAHFIVNNAEAEWRFYLLIGAGLAIGFASDLNRRRDLGGRYRSAGFRTDCLYLLVDLTHAAHLAILVPLAAYLTAFLSSGAPWLKLAPLAALPAPAKLVLMFVVTDLCAYGLHRMLHANRYLWQFHKVHHSQQQLSSLTTFRMPVLDRTVALIVLTIPAVVLASDAVMPVTVLLALQFHQLLLHSDVGWTFGPARHILVSPAMHEAHHSLDPAHVDRNFGSVLSVWDRLFRSHAERGRGELRYGLSGDTVPESFLRQIVVPLVGVCEQLRRDLERLRPLWGKTVS